MNVPFMYISYKRSHTVKSTPFTVNTMFDLLGEKKRYLVVEMNTFTDTNNSERINRLYNKFLLVLLGQ